MGVLAATILFIATNAGLIGVSRLTYSMGQYRQLPERLRVLHPKFRTPHVAIILFGAIACLAIVPGQADFLGVIYAFGAMLSFTMAHAAVIALRFSQPDHERPWRSPGRIRMRGVDAAAVRRLRWARDGGRAGGGDGAGPASAHLRHGLAGRRHRPLRVYRRRQGLPLTETRKVVLREPAVEHEVEYESVLVAFEDSHYSAEAVATAAKLAARRRRGIHVLVTITVPANAPIDAPLPEQEADAQEVIDSARAIGGRRVTGHWEKVRAGEHGRRIVQRGAGDQGAGDRHGAAARAAPAGSLFGKTLETVLADRPCRVIIDSAPRGSRADRRAPRPKIPRVQRAYLASSRVLSALLLLIGRRRWSSSALAGGGGALALGVVARAAVRARSAARGCGSRARARGATGEPRARSGRAAAAGPPQSRRRVRPRAGRAGAVRGRAQRGRLVDLLRPRGRGRRRARPDAGSSSCSPGVFFVITMITYVEGNSLHPERGGAATFARYAFNELWSFVAGWAMLLDYLIVMAIGAFAVSHYLAAFWGVAGDSGAEIAIAAATLAFTAFQNIRGITAARLTTVLRISLVNLVLSLRDHRRGRWRRSSTPA